MKVSLPSAEELRKKTGENRQGGEWGQGIATFRIQGIEATRLSRRKKLQPKVFPGFVRKGL